MCTRQARLLHICPPVIRPGKRCRSTESVTKRRTCVLYNEARIIIIIVKYIVPQKGDDTPSVCHVCSSMQANDLGPNLILCFSVFLSFHFLLFKASLEVDSSYWETNWIECITYWNPVGPTLIWCKPVQSHIVLVLGFFANVHSVRCVNCNLSRKCMKMRTQFMYKC